MMIIVNSSRLATSVSTFCVLMVLQVVPFAAKADVYECDNGVCTLIASQQTRLPVSFSEQYIVSDFSEIIQEAANLYNLDERLIESVIAVESNFDPRTRSEKGAIGLMQLMPDTAKELGVVDPYDPRTNILGGSKYLSQQIIEFNENLELALGAYHSGATRIKRNNGITGKRTRKYVEDVLSEYSKRLNHNIMEGPVHKTEIIFKPSLREGGYLDHVVEIPKKPTLRDN